jgi:hypothetical protein
MTCTFNEHGLRPIGQVSVGETLSVLPSRQGRAMPFIDGRR